MTYGSPLVRGCARAALLVDLEEDGAEMVSMLAWCPGGGGLNILSARLPVMAARGRALGHVGHDGADVGLGPEGPAQTDGRAGLGGRVEGGGRGTLGAAGGPASALDVDQGEVLDGAVALDGAGDALGLGGQGWTLALVGWVLTAGFVYGSWNGWGSRSVLS